MPVISEGEVKKTIVGLQGQLNSIFQTDDLIRDFTLLSGFLTFVHSKLQRLIETSLENELKKQLKLESGENVASEVQIDIKTIPYILDLSWERLWYPIFKWFQAYRKKLLSAFAGLKRGQRPNFYVIFRKFNSKVGKFSTSLTKFYLDLIRLIQSKIDTSRIIPSEIISKTLGSKKQRSSSESEATDLRNLSPNAPLTPLILLIHHRCLFYLGVLNRYRAMTKKISNDYMIDDFRTSKEYLDTAILLCPAIGETFFQIGLIYFQTENFGLGVYELVRGSLSSLPSLSAINNFRDIFLKKECKIRERAIKTIRRVHLDSLNGARIPNRKIIEYYFLVLFGYNFEKSTWRDSDTRDKVLGGIGIKHIEQVFYERVASGFIKNIELIFKNLVIAIGGFSLLLQPKSEHSDFIEEPSTLNLSSQGRSYSRFVFKYISKIFEDVISKIWKDDFETFYYLGIVCTVLAWLLSNQFAMDYAMSDDLFVKSFSTLWNDIQRNIDTVLEEDKVKDTFKREYYFEEDIILANFTCISFSECLFDNSKIFGSDDMVDRIEGFVPKAKKLSKREEAKVRLIAILHHGKDILLKNKCNVVLNSKSGLFETLPRQGSRDTNKRDSPKTSTSDLRRKDRRKKGADQSDKSIEALEADIMRKRFAVAPAFSGPSIPAAPQTLKTKPSLNITSKTGYGAQEHSPTETTKIGSPLKADSNSFPEGEVGASGSPNLSSPSSSSSSLSSPEPVMTMDSIESTMKELSSQMKMLMYSNSDRTNDSQSQRQAASQGVNLVPTPNALPRSISGNFSTPLASPMYPYGMGPQNAQVNGHFYSTLQPYVQPIGVPPNAVPPTPSFITPWQPQQQLQPQGQNLVETHQQSQQQYSMLQYPQTAMPPVGQPAMPGYVPYMQQPPPGLHNNTIHQQPQLQNSQQVQWPRQQYQEHQHLRGGFQNYAAQT